LARRLTEWSMTDPQLKEFFSQQPDYLSDGAQPQGGASATSQPLVVTTGGGPGIMEAANKGARSVPGAKTMGMGISLPFEKGLNPFVSKDLAFEFHYFFTRKFWMMYSVKALVIGPGGFGTLDEMFELLTLRQTGKIPDVPIVLLGSHFWKTIINWQALADFGTVSQAEIDRLFFADTCDAAFDHIVNTISKLSVSPTQGPGFPSIPANHHESDHANGLGASPPQLNAPSMAHPAMVSPTSSMRGRPPANDEPRPPTIQLT